MGKSGNKPRVSKLAAAVGKAEPKEQGGDVFDFGKFRVRFVDCSEGETGSLCVKLKGVGDDEEIGERVQWFSTAGKALHVSAPRLKSLCMALVGISDKEEYSEFDPNNEFVNTILPYDVDAAAAYLVEAGKAKSEKAARAILESTEFTIKVTKGSERDDGDFFRNASFAAVTDSEDEDDDDDDSDEEPESEAKPKRAAKKAPRRPEPEDDEDEEDDSDDDDSDDDEPESEPAPKRAAKKAKRK
jgi:hypothetical protein